MVGDGDGSFGSNVLTTLGGGMVGVSSSSRSGPGGQAPSPTEEVRAPMPTVRDTLIGGPVMQHAHLPLPHHHAAPLPADAALGAPPVRLQLPTPDSLTWSGAVLAQVSSSRPATMTSMPHHRPWLWWWL